MRDDELKELLRAQLDREAVPGFDRCWGDARRRAAENGRRLDWRWGLAPGLATALGAAAIVLNFLVPSDGSHPGPAPAPRAEPARHAVMTVPSAEKAVTVAEQDGEQLSAQPLALDWLLDDISALSENGLASRGNRDYLAENLQTDFLLAMEIPAWEETGTREVL